MANASDLNNINDALNSNGGSNPPPSFNDVSSYQGASTTAQPNFLTGTSIPVEEAALPQPTPTLTNQLNAPLPVPALSETVSSQGITTRVQTPDATPEITDQTSIENASESLDESLPDHSERVTPTTSTIQFKFTDFACDPIEGLKYKIMKGDERLKIGATDSNGFSVALDELKPGTELDVMVYREHVQDYKKVGTVVTAPGNNSYTCVSPKLRFEFNTEAHQGTPGQAHQDLPPAPKTYEELTTSGAAAVPAPASVSAASLTNTQAPAPTPPVVRAPAPAVTAPAANRPSTTSIAQPARPIAATPSPTAAPATANRQAVPAGRDANGHPIAKVEDRGVDWLKRKVLAMYNAWTWSDFKKATAAPVKPTTAAEMMSPARPANATAQTAGHPLINPISIAASPAQGIVPSEDSLRMLNGLIAFHEKQATIDYGMSAQTAPVLATYAAGTATTYSTKAYSLSRGRCLVWVKVALFRCGFTNGVTGTVPAKDSGRDWVRFGFADVTSTLPSIKIFSKSLDDELPGLLGNQPDVSYTMPGDVVVYEERAQPNRPGHIDIRTYHGFGSDFFWSRGARSGFPDVRKYKVIGVYRKFSDTLALARVYAFLQIIREKETDGFKDPYTALKLDFSNRANPFVTFNNFEDHPSNEASNKPAGAYQIKWQTWNQTIQRNGWARSFDRETQNRIAIFLLQQRNVLGCPEHPNRTALGLIMEGLVEQAINNTKLWNEWSVLPGGRDPKLTMDQVKNLFAVYTKNYSH